MWSATQLRILDLRYKKVPLILDKSVKEWPSYIGE